MLKILGNLVTIAFLLSMSSCRELLFPDVDCYYYGPFGIANIGFAPPDYKTTLGMSIMLGRLEPTSNYKVVITTTEYPDTAPPYTGTTNLSPLSTDYTFFDPVPNAQRDPLLLPATGCIVNIKLRPEIKPAAPLYIYIIKKEGSGYVPSGIPHLTTKAELATK